MNRIILLSSLILASTIDSNGQEAITFSKVIQADSLNQAKLFTTINEWFASTYNSAKDVIQVADKEAGLIVGNGSMNYTYGKMAYRCYEGHITYTIKVSVKDNRYKVELTQFTHAVNFGNAPSCSLGLVSTSEFYATSGMSKNYHNNVWQDIKLKAEQYSMQIFDSLEKKTKTKDDW